MAIRFLTAGESHGPALLAILDGMPAGIPLDITNINQELARRQKGFGAGPRMKLENDEVRILSGVMAGLTTGAPLALSIQNLDFVRWRGKPVEPFTTPRPGHVDLAALLKFGYDDIRPGFERASARETAARVAVGAICKQFLNLFQITIGGYVHSIGGIEANYDQIPFLERVQLAEQNDLRCPDFQAVESMTKAIQSTIKQKDTLGGIIEIIGLGLPAGLGSHTQWDQRLEARLGAAILSVQAIKGVEIGDAFSNASLPGTSAHDPIRIDGKHLIRPTNRSGGTEGGISTGQPLIIRAAMKPIATTLTPQQTVNLASGEEVPTKYERSDFCPVPRAVPILEAMVAFVVADSLIEKLGGDSIQEMQQRYLKIRRSHLDDIRMKNENQIFWPEDTDG
jgi:chorismate synthase